VSYSDIENFKWPAVRVAALVYLSNYSLKALQKFLAAVPNMQGIQPEDLTQVMQFQ
jgi:hypothetical protein